MLHSLPSFFWSSSVTKISKIHVQKSPRSYITLLGVRWGEVLLFDLESPSVYTLTSLTFPPLSSTVKTLFSKLLCWQWNGCFRPDSSKYCLFSFFLQFHNSDCLSTWLLHFIATNYLIFSQKPEFQDLSGNLPITFKTRNVFQFCLD